MSAMHWEARRRQQVLDRRSSARIKQEENQDNKEEKSNALVKPCEPVGKPAQNNKSNTEADKQCICKCHTKMRRRYTSLQYSQQW